MFRGWISSCELLKQGPVGGSGKARYAVPERFSRGFAGCGHGALASHEKTETTPKLERSVRDGLRYFSDQLG